MPRGSGQDLAPVGRIVTAKELESAAVRYYHFTGLRSLSGLTKAELPMKKGFVSAGSNVETFSLTGSQSLLMLSAAFAMGMTLLILNWIMQPLKTKLDQGRTV